jgi:hypothetical protein
MSKTKMVLASLLLTGAILITSSLFSGFGLLGPTPASASGGSKVGPVQVPVILDGVRYESDDYNRLKDSLTAQGTILRYVLTPEAQKQGLVYVFTSEKGEWEFKIKHGFRVDLPSPVDLPKSPSVLALTTASYTPLVIYWEGIYFTQSHLIAQAGTGNNDLRNVPCCNGGNWNDRISSVDVGDGAASYNWENINYQGARLTIGGPLSLSNLAQIGWDDVISSFWIYWQA